MAATSGGAPARAGWVAFAFGVAGFVASVLGQACLDGDAPARGPGRPLGGTAVSSDAGVSDGASCAEGESRPCHVALGENGGVTSCFVGASVCRDGRFGPCIDGSVSTYSAQAAPAAPSLLGGLLPGPCPSNPCDPYCQSLQEQPDGGVALAVSQQGTYLGGSVSDMPAGFQNKGLKDTNHPPSFTPCSAAADCQFDTHCVAGECVAWARGETDPLCTGVDLTAGAACSGTVPVCNRGQATAPAGVQVLVFTGNDARMQNDLGTCSGYGASIAGTCSTMTPIPPGGCVDVLGCPLTGTGTIVVNPASPPASSAPIDECQCGNNWTAHGLLAACSTLGAPPLTETTFSLQYQPACPPGTRLQWGYLTYQAVVPADASGTSTVSIGVRTAEPPALLSTVGFADLLLGTVPSSAPALCAMGGPAPCPQDLFVALGGLPRASDGLLELDFKLTPTPSGALGPVLSSWELTFSCPPAE